MNNVTKLAFDTKYGGVYNALENGSPVEDEKVWWPQAETVIALINCYQITGNENYIQQSNQLISYIENVFIDPLNGEWYSSVSIEGKPNVKVPKIHFWKSLYHNVRYYVEVIERIQLLKI